MLFIAVAGAFTFALWSKPSRSAPSGRNSNGGGDLIGEAVAESPECQQSHPVVHGDRGMNRIAGAARTKRTPVRMYVPAALLFGPAGTGLLIMSIDILGFEGWVSGCLIMALSAGITVLAVRLRRRRSDLDQADRPLRADR
jgi:Flp pilus assembly protein TadB